MFLSYQSNISFQWNTDGVPLFSSSSYSMWPLYLKIKSLAGVWFGDKKPSINTFLKPLCTTMNSLFYNGLTVQPPEQCDPIVCKTIVLSGTCDIPAKTTALNMIGHNGFFACPYCEQPGRSLTVGNGCVYVYHIVLVIHVVQQEHIQMLKKTPKKACRRDSE